MSPIIHRSRLHLLAAKDAPTLVILQRRRAKQFHVITLDTKAHRIREGSWFRGVLYPVDCDVSFDGKYMVYRARGGEGDGATWSGVCELPWLRTLVHVAGSYVGGGCFAGPRELATNRWDRGDAVMSRDIPFKVVPSSGRYPVRPPGMIYQRFERDGFVRLGDNWGHEQKIAGKTSRLACIGDDGWGLRPARRHPMLQVRYLGYSAGLTYLFGFTLYEHPQLLEGATWATWDVRKTLWVARPGIVEQYTLDDMRRGRPSFSLDVDQFAPTVKPEREDGISSP